jgi:hypothetical protein
MELTSAAEASMETIVALARVDSTKRPVSSSAENGASLMYFASPKIISRNKSRRIEEVRK